ncbi:putative glycosyltransferase [Senna tora]|uniref:Putative glycosyltransferase n=1 Tax=Senna tora TaxID=362788 RepID=A0A834SL44_9FABA|nr:putative glycosyltransferase [Senna tora]
MRTIRSPTSGIFLTLFFLNLSFVFFTFLKDEQHLHLHHHHHHHHHLVSHVSINSSSANQSLDKHRLKNKRRSSLERIEEGLAAARASIKEAIGSRKYEKSNEKGIFVPKGPIYWNPHAFHQSHTEMMKRLKVWVYREGDPPLVHEGPVNNKYAIEGQFIDEIENGKNSRFKARHPDEAHVFFIPLSVAKVIHYVYKPRRTKYDYEADRLQHLVEDYISIVAQRYPYWNRSNGADHFLLSCHDWGPRISYGNPYLFHKMMRVLCNANTTEGFKPSRDVSIPEVLLPFGKLAPPDLSLPPRRRTILAFFAGGAHGAIRKKLLKQWKDKDDAVQVHEYLPKGQNYTKLMGKSKFCLCPSGHEVASPRVVEAIHAGCVPVILCENYTVPFGDVLDWRRFSMEIRVERIGEIKEILEGVSEKEYLEMYGNVRKVKRHFVMNRPAKPFDLMHMREMNHIIHTSFPMKDVDKNNMVDHECTSDSERVNKKEDESKD